MWDSNQEKQDAPAERADKLRMALAAPASDIGTIEGQHGTVDNQHEAAENRQIKWWALALPILVLIIIAAAHVLNVPAATVADSEDSRQYGAALPEESTSSKRSDDRFPHDAFVSSIAYNQNGALAFINDEMVPEGGTVDGLTILKIHQDSVEFEKDGQRWTQRVGE